MERHTTMERQAFSEWAGRHDLQRPAFPYHDKPCLDIWRHIPPEPYGNGYIRGKGPKEADRNEIAACTISQWCLEHPVADTPPHPDQTVHRLRIMDEIACEDGRGAQLVRCLLDNNIQFYVAKIYDPLYYSFANDFSGLPVDLTWTADHDYSREAAAYEELKEEGVDGILAPKYHGSWTFNMPLADSVRSVRMILMDWVHGVSLDSLLKNKEVLRIAPEQRLEIFAHALEIKCKTLYHYISHRYFSPRNVIVVGLDESILRPKPLEGSF